MANLPSDIHEAIPQISQRCEISPLSVRQLEGLSRDDLLRQIHRRDLTIGGLREENLYLVEKLLRYEQTFNDLEFLIKEQAGALVRQHEQKGK
jgi:hypothetical protein